MIVRKRQKGFSLVTAIFLIVILGALAGFIVSISNVQHTTTGQSINGVRAYFAARSGIEWGIGQAINATNCAAGPVRLTIGAYSVDVGCTSTAHIERGQPFTIFSITSIASFGNPIVGPPSVDAVRRVITVSVTNAP